MKWIFRLALVLAVWLVNASASAQSDVLKQFQNNVNVLSPDAASIAKFVEVPVSYFNGVPDISIPLYEISEGDIKVPLVIRYHAGGIGVGQEASLIGLGWSLDVGGSISVDVRNKDDFSFNGYCSHTGPLPTQSANFDNAHYTRVTSDNCTYYSEDGTYHSYPAGDIFTLDGEPDLYVYSFPGYSGKFMFKKNVDNSLTSECLNTDNILFTRNTVSSMTAVSPDGFEYTFGANEISQNYHVEGSGINTVVGYSQGVNTSFYLTGIKSPQGRQVNFYYSAKPAEGNGVRTMNFTFQYMIGADGGPNPWVSSHPETSGIQLDSIVFSSGVIKFSKSNRDDLQGGKKLDMIEIFNKKKILIKKYVFNYDYFQGDIQYGDQFGQHSGISRSDYTEGFRKLRLKLQSLQEVANDNNFPTLNHQFYYNTTSLPYKTSFARDYWGFFNGINNSTLLPSGPQLMAYYMIPDWFMQYQGANREANEVKMQAGILTEIKYPTGGSVKFEYEANRFSNTMNGSAIQQAGATDFNPPTSSTDINYNNPISQEFTILAQVASINFTLTRSSTEQMQCTAGPTANCLWVSIDKKNSSGQWASFIARTFQSTNIMSQVESINLPDGTYRVQAHYPDQSVGDIRNNSYATISMQYFAVTNDIVTKLGGGLRVKRIEHSDPVASKSWAKRITYGGSLNLNMPIFTYENDNSTTSASCNTFDGCCYGENCANVQLGKSVTLYSDAVLRYSNSANGSAVGYFKVTSESEGGQNGKTEYEFNLRSSDNAPGFLIPGLQTENILDNGLLTFQKDYKYENSQYVEIKEIQNIYTIYNKKLFWGFKTEIKIPLYSCNGSTPTPVTCAMCGMETLHFYPIRAAKVGVQYTYERHWDGTKFMQSLHSYQYNQQGYVSSESFTNSDNVVNVKEIKYPKDFTPGAQTWIDTLQTRNIINVPIEVLNKVNTNVTAGTFLKYRTKNMVTTPYQVYIIKTYAPKLIASSAPSGSMASDFKLEATLGSDAIGNINQILKPDNIPTSYIWGYYNAHPIAVVANASPYEVAFTSFGLDEGNGNWTIPSSLRATTGINTSACYTLSNGNISKSGLVSNKKYLISYWSAGAAATISGTTGVVLQTKPGWTLYQHTLQQAATSFAISGSVTIDELRFHPYNAQMTTYSFDPLVGMRSTADANNRFTFYNYDRFNRLRTLQDDKQKILKYFQYNYQLPTQP